MAKRTEDHIQDEVRRRISQYHAAAGVPSGDIAKEVLYLLPSEFVRAYLELFWRALGEPVSPQGDGGKDEGRIKARGISKSPMNTRNIPAAQAGRKYVQSVWPVRDEKAMDAKVKLDRQLVRAAEKTWRELGGPSELRGNAASKNSQQRRCGECGQFQGPGWLRCPFHE